jgi:transcriptional regulator with XRE-family HTH domain
VLPVVPVYARCVAHATGLRLANIGTGHEAESQLALASAAQVTPRHVSFVKTGRARPSRDMVLTLLARTLDVPLRGRNQMLLAAGYAPVYRESELGEATMARVRTAVERMLNQHEQFPAVVLDRYWNVTLVNDAASAMFRWLLGSARAVQPTNVIRLMFDPDGPAHGDAAWARPQWTDLWGRGAHTSNLGSVAADAIPIAIQIVDV